jgi:hypothetical protein
LNNTTAMVIDFISKQCKDNLHSECSGRWEGLGFEFICTCRCKHDKNSQALESVHQPSSNTNQSIQPSTVRIEVHQENDL